MVYLYDDRADVTYFVRRVGDPLVFAVVVFDSFRGRRMKCITQNSPLTVIYFRLHLSFTLLD